MGKEVIESHLKAICDELGMSKAGDLVKVVNKDTYRVRPGTIYDLYDDVLKRVPLDKLAIILTDLNKIAHEQGLNKVYDVCDILKYKNN